MTADAVPLELERWLSLRPWQGPLQPTDQVLVISPTAGSKSTLIATLTLRDASLVAVDDKGTLELPRARSVALPYYGPPPRESRRTRTDPWPASTEFRLALAEALAWQEVDRVVLHVHPLDVEEFIPHDAIYRELWERQAASAAAGEEPYTRLWIDEISGTGADSYVVQRYLRAWSARARSMGGGLVTASQAAYSLIPAVLVRNANLVVIGPQDQRAIANLPYDDVEIAGQLRLRSGKFLVYETGSLQPKRLYLPIPRELADWRAP